MDKDSASAWLPCLNSLSPMILTLDCSDIVKRIISSPIFCFEVDGSSLDIHGAAIIHHSPTLDKFITGSMAEHALPRGRRCPRDFDPVSWHN